uniref:Uncharacterized protein n=1 Tax=Ascaris lumbricoides TaxID=6252 RepID=A0A0M3HTR6_ASCLU
MWRNEAPEGGTHLRGTHCAGRQCDALWQDLLLRPHGEPRERQSPRSCSRFRQFRCAQLSTTF